MDWLQAAKIIQAETIALRREFHRRPELGFEEVWSSQKIFENLVNLGWTVKKGVAKTGLLALMDSGKPGPCLALRFDMDALPVNEESEVEYRSEIPGKMHACGHDGHMAAGLACARLLAENREFWRGKVKLIFQPGEEGQGGARAMIRSGALEDPKPDAILGMHLWNEIPIGCYVIKAGALMAGSSIFHILIRGRGGHGAMPDQTVDPVLAAAQLVSALQSIISRRISPLNPAVVSVTCIHAGESFNVIPGEAFLKGTIRSFDLDELKMIESAVKEMSVDLCRAMGCQAEVKITDLTPPLINADDLALLAQKVLPKRLNGLEMDCKYQTAASEDMAYYQQQVPGLFLFIGSAPESGAYPHHHPRFDIDERAITYAAAALTTLVEELSRGA